MRIIKSKRAILIALLLCASIQTAIAIEESPSTAIDPFEKYNRAMFKFNEKVDTVFLKPLATVYNGVLPSPVRKCISNFFSNLNMVPTVINDLLQANFYQATSDSWRLLVNSTIGIAGFFDVGSQIGLEANAEDFGLTLARWGYTHSSYFVVPFLGPSTIRDGIAFPINYEFMTVYPYINPIATRYAIYGLGVVDRRAELLHYNNLMEAAAFDKYVFQRDAYLQRRNYLIQRNTELGNPYLEQKKEDTHDS